MLIVRTAASTVGGERTININYKVKKRERGGEERGKGREEGERAEGSST